MPRPKDVSPFPRGIADTVRGRAFLADRAGAIVALDLTTGTVLWRAGRAQRPLTIVAGDVVAARAADPTSIVLAMFSGADGRELAVSQSVRLPDWANADVTNREELSLTASATGRDVALRWAASRRYQGGAAATARALAGVEHEAIGGALINLDDGRVRDLPDPTPAPAPDPTEPPAPDPTEPRAAESNSSPDIIEQHDVGSVRYQLAAKPTEASRVDIAVRAVDPVNGRVIWQTVIDTVPAQRPRPPRP